MDNKYVGRYIEYHNNGNVAIVGTYDAGVKKGKWKGYNSDGKLSWEQKYKHGTLVYNRIIELGWPKKNP